MDSSPSVLAADHVSSRPVACLHCRQRRSYCSKDKPSCSRCRDGGLECVYEGARKVLVNESYLRQLEAKAQALEAALAQLRTTPATGREEQRSNDDSELDADEQSLLEPFTQLNLEHRPSSSSGFQGPASSDTFLSDVGMLSGLHVRLDGLDDTLLPRLYSPDALPSHRHSPLLRLRARLPPIDTARRLFAAQYLYIGTIFAFTDPRDSFDQLLAQVYAAGEPPDVRDRHGCLAHAKVLLVLAYGQLYSINQWVGFGGFDGFGGPPGFDLFSDALMLLPDSHEEGSLLCVETLALAGYFMQNMDRRDAALQYVGRALRMAISLGMHHEAVGLDDESRERRRRLWWSVYSLDRILSVKSGNPMAVQDEDIEVILPSPLPGEAAYCPAVVLRHYTELSRILGQIHASIYRRPAARRSGRSLMASVQAVLRTLSRWLRDLPEALRFGQSRESVGTLAHYYQCINMTARPLLFHVLRRRLAEHADRGRDWKAGLSDATLSVVEMCIEAAQNTVSMMAVAAQRDMVATYGYMDGEHILCATIVLVIACAALPSDTTTTATMNTGLDLLRGMGERGNSRMGARYERLAALRAATLAPSSPTPGRHATTFAVVDHGALDEPMYGGDGDKSGAADMDFGFWEEGFACADLGLDQLAPRPSVVVSPANAVAAAPQATPEPTLEPASDGHA